MKKFKTVCSAIIMIIAAIMGLFVGALLNEAMGGAILFAVIAGFSRVIYAIDNPENKLYQSGNVIYSPLFKYNLSQGGV